MAGAGHGRCRLVQAMAGDAPQSCCGLGLFLSPMFSPYHNMRLDSSSKTVSLNPFQQDYTVALPSVISSPEKLDLAQHDTILVVDRLVGLIDIFRLFRLSRL